MAETTTYESTAGGHPTSPVAIAVAWIVVIIPAAWGITQTLKQATQLFKAPPSQTAPSGVPISAPAPGPAPTTTTAPATR